MAKKGNTIKSHGKKKRNLIGVEGSLLNLID